MTHDYGINPCCFEKDYTPTPNLLTEGGCMSQIRKYLDVDGINSGRVKAYITAIAGQSNDNCYKKTCPHEPKNGKKHYKDGNPYISPKYRHLIFAAEITKVMTIEEYLANDDFERRKDYLSYKADPTKNQKENIILSNRFSYFGKDPYKLPDEIDALFPKGRGQGYNKNKYSEYTDILVNYIEGLLKNPIINDPFYKLL